ncbi:MULTISPECIES: methyltransferase domain-containing protein [unclassified Caballeronia]|uniref:methyltransferase domain-containing protein n=1 Tax=unclassified Caballeronia TaxID=2646786 RepID=UPI00202871D2|nr:MULTISPECIES: methyltransferase domain-containing protein [unclassified Caballeronia]
MQQAQIDHVAFSDYETESNRLWMQHDSRPSPSTGASDLADLIVNICGLGSVLDAGCGAGDLVRELTSAGINARGVDVSQGALAEAQSRHPGRFSQGNLLHLPFADSAFDTVVAERSLEFLDETDIPRALSELARVSKRFLILRIATGDAAPGPWRRIAQGRAFWEGKCFEAGLRKHPLFYDVNAYESLNQDGAEIVIPLEKIPEAANRQYPLSALREERDLHMDMLREHGSRSDAHVGRYHFASRYVRPGDVVLDAACGLGYGSYVIQKSTQCGPVTGIDGSAYGVDYATANFGIPDKLSYIEGFLPDCLANIPSNSVDTVLSFETLEHVEAPEALLREFHRILTPGGRLVASVPHDWSDETGEDPNPFHLHVYDRKKFVTQLSGEFEVEAIFSQTADRVKKPGGNCEWLVRPRSLAEIEPAPENLPVEAEWLLAVACKSPLNGASVPYEERIFSDGEREASGHALAFDRDYENPWLVRAVVSIGLRTEKAHLREKWALGTLEHASPFSADRGAALCILAYMARERDVGIVRSALVEAIDAYLASEPANPNALRWHVSLRFVRALMELTDGNRANAERFLQQVIDGPAAQYSPTLLTKCAESALLQGTLHAADGDIEGARAIWQRGYRGILATVGEHLSMPYPSAPPKFELREIGAVVTLAGRLATASAYASELTTRPAIFQRQSADDIAMYIGNLERGKAWLSSAWHASVSENEEKQAYLRQVLEGKDWLEGQWRHFQSRTQELETQLAEREHEKRDLAQQQRELIESTQRLEAQLQETQAHLHESQAQLQETQVHLQESQRRRQRLEASLPVRVARKLGRRYE